MGPADKTTTTKYIGIIVQSSLKGVTIPRGWGTAKMGCNLVDYLDFSAKQVEQSGKGGSQPAQYDYKATLLLAICLGPIAGIRTIYKDSAIYTATAGGSQEVNGTTVTISPKTPVEATGLSALFDGQIGQLPWGYLTSNHLDHAIGYSGMAYAAAENYDLNSSATAPNHNFEVQFSVRATVGGAVIDDANPADIVTDLLPDVTRWPAGAIADLTDYGNYCTAAGLWLSPVADQGRQASDLLTEILTASNSDCYWSDGQLHITPYGDTAITANGVTWTPDLTPLYDLDWDDIVPNSDGEDPIQWDVKRPMDAYNYVQVGYQDRTQQYASDTATAVDQANINTFGKRQQDPVSLNSVCRADVANTLAQLMVQRSANVRRTAEFDVPELFGLLDPMDLITVPLRNGGRRLMRIVEANEQGDGTIQLQCEEMLVGTAHAATYQRQDALGIPANFGVDPGPTNPPVIINPPQSLTGGQLQAWIGASGGADWGGAVVWSSLDDATYQQVGRITQPARYGVTTTNLPATADPDTADTLGVDLTMSGATLTTASNADADAGVTLCAVGTEVIAFSAATLTAPSKYDLSGYIRRGLEGTAVALQPAGSEFLRLDDSVGVVSYTSGQVGKTLFIKLQSFNVYGNAFEDLDLCTAYEFIAQQNGANVGEIEWTEILGVPAALTAYVATGGTAVNTANVGSATAAQIEVLPADVQIAVSDISANASNIAAEVLRGSARDAYFQAMATLNGQAIGVVIAANTAQQATANASFVSTLNLIGAVNGAGTAIVFDGSTAYVDPATTLAEHLTYVSDTLGDGSITLPGVNASLGTTNGNLSTLGGTVASIDTTVSGQTARITVAVNSNGEAVGFDIGTSGHPGTGFFDIVSPNFRLIDVSSGQTLVPMSYSAGVGWVFDANVRINGDLLVNGSIETGSLAPFSVTNTPYTENTSPGSLGAINSGPYPVGGLSESVGGGPIRIDVVATFVNTDGGHDQLIQLILQRDGSQISEPFHCFTRANTSSIAGGWPGDVCASFLDAGAAAGSHTWSVTAQLIGGTNNNTLVTLCRLILQELKTET